MMETCPGEAWVCLCLVSNRNLHDHLVIIIRMYAQTYLPTEFDLFETKEQAKEEEQEQNIHYATESSWYADIEFNGHI